METERRSVVARAAGGGTRWSTEDFGVGDRSGWRLNGGYTTLFIELETTE